MKFSRQLAIGSLTILALSACSSDPTSRRQAKDEFGYTNATLTQGWEVLPTARRQYYRQFQIPEGEFGGAIGEAVDIRPPQQILELIPGARYTIVDTGVVLWPSSAQETANIWQSIQTMIDKRGISLRAQDDVHYETDWVDLTAEDEPHPIASRYSIEKVRQGSRLGILVSLIEFRDDGEVQELTPELVDRYSRNMVNYVTSQYDNQLREAQRQQAEQSISNVQVAMATDRSGLPILVARAPYSIMWTKLERALPQLGFKIGDRNESQGQISTTYRRQSDEFYEDLFVEPVTLSNQAYTVLLGDLNNRTSINLTDSDGKPVEQSELESLMPALEAVLSNSDTSL